MTDPFQVQAYAVAGMAAVADTHRWKLHLCPDGTVRFVPPSRQSDATCRAVRARLHLAGALAPLDFLGFYDDALGCRTLDAAADEVASLHWSQAEFESFILEEARKVRRILSARASEVDELAVEIMNHTKAPRQ